MDLFACSAWHSKADSASTAATLPVAEAAVSSSAVSDAANPATGTAAVSVNAATALSGVHAADPPPGAVMLRGCTDIDSDVCKYRCRMSTGFPANFDGNVENLSMNLGGKAGKHQNHILKTCRIIC